MAHEIDTTTGEAACFVAGTPPWHRLGTVVSEAQTSAEAIRLAKLDWTVEQWPVFARKDGVEKPVGDRVANVRSDTQAVLGVTHQLVEKQVNLWAAAVEKTEQLGARQQERLATAIGQALEFALTRYGKRLAELEEALLARNQALLDSVNQLANALRDSGREHQLTLARLTDGLDGVGPLWAE